MRLSQSRRSDIEDTILDDLYKPPKKKIDDQKGALVLRNHTEWVGKYMPLIKQLPEHMIHTSDQIKLDIPALESEETDEYKKCNKTTWTQYVDSGLPTLMKGRGWSAEDVPIPLQDGMKAEILALRAEEWNLTLEKRNMQEYLSNTLDRNNTTSKLRKAFPSTLQKYIPPEPPRAARKPKTLLETELDETVVSLPDNLKQRMTENLLEN